MNISDDDTIPPHRSEILPLYIKRRNLNGHIHKFRIVAWNDAKFRFVNDNENDEYVILKDVHIYDDDNKLIYYDHIHINVSPAKKEMFRSFANSYIEMLVHPRVYTRKNGTRDFSFSGIVKKSIKKVN